MNMHIINTARAAEATVASAGVAAVSFLADLTLWVQLAAAAVTCIVGALAVYDRWNRRRNR